MSEDKQRGEANKGFAGLTSLLSDVEASGNTRQTSAQAESFESELLAASVHRSCLLVG